MDQLIALAAAHKSTVSGGRAQHFYCTESIRLQTRALAHIDFGHDAVDNDNSVVLFAFSALLGQHMLFGILAFADTLGVMLNKLIQCFNLHQGIRATASKAWARLRPTMLGDHGVNQSYIMENPQHSTQGTECAMLLDQLRSSTMDQLAIDSYYDTIKIL
ncbi:hypothetical protein S40293_04857 [Stachybotrys chartarum IBT 40293]|nr:hypothetical protein S40293_04857 [Stachybotrys chartarum IBT 40293]